MFNKIIKCLCKAIYFCFILFLLANISLVKTSNINDDSMMVETSKLSDSSKSEEHQKDNIVVEDNNDEENQKTASSNKDKEKDNQNKKDSIGIIRFENGKEVYIYDNPTDEHMNLGAGKLINGAILNESGNSILFSHRETHFKILKNIKKGDIITIKTTKSSKNYKVINTYVTEDDNPKPYKSSDDIRITLITCYPFIAGASAEERYVVVAHLFT